MRKACLSLLVAVSFLTAADELVKPDKLTIHTWVREDMFAGWISNDSAILARGVQKLDRFLADHPNDYNANSWKFLAASFGMIQARNKGDDAAYSRELAISKDLRAKIFMGDQRDPGPYIIVGSSLVRTACFAPEKDRGWMMRDGRDMLVKVIELQGEVFEKLPPHFRGEIWAQLAFANDRLGETAARDRALENMLTRLGGTPYESRARAWQKPGAIAKEKDYACMSCHDPGRLAPTLARLSAANAK
jgi:hypothetical protein